MRVEVWSDITCPWCYVGLARFTRALSAFEHRSQVKVQHRSFELQPDAERAPGGSNVEMLVEKYGQTREQVLEMEGRLAGLAAEEGLEYTPERPIGNTFDIHRLLHLARTQGYEADLRAAVWQAHFGEGRGVFTAADLAPVAVSVGLEQADVDRVLADTTYAEQVRADEGRAHSLGVNGVPFFVLGDIDSGAQAYGLSGAQPYETFEAALDKAWTTSQTPA